MLVENSIVQDRSLSKFRMAYDPCTISGNACNRLRKKSLLGIAGGSLRISIKRTYGRRPSPVAFPSRFIQESRLSPRTARLARSVEADGLQVFVAVNPTFVAVDADLYPDVVGHSKADSLFLFFP